MDVTSTFLLSLLEKMCVFVVIAYLVTRTKFFTKILDHDFSRKNIIIFTSIFGLISIFAVASGIDIFDTEADMADLAPITAGLVGGPIIGLAVGIIAGFSRYLVGGPGSLIISISIIFSGLFAGLIYSLNKRKFIGMAGSVIYTIFMGFITILLVMFLYPQYVNFTIFVGIPIIISNTLGILIFSFMISNLIKERKTSKERDKYSIELEWKKEDLKIARHIQESFLPKEIPHPKKFDLYALNVPAMEVGGDFYDFIPINNERIGLLIADVSGKSVPAALFMAFSRTLIQAKATGNHEVVNTIKDVNSFITKEAEDGMFITLFYSVLNCKEKTITYVNAGHNPPALYRAETGDIKLLKTKGMALGVIEEAEFDEKKVKMKKGDILIYYTDGVTEAINDNNEQFGEKRLFELVKENNELTAEKMVVTITKEVSEFQGKEAQFDDITLMVLKAV